MNINWTAPFFIIVISVYTCPSFLHRMYFVRGLLQYFFCRKEARKMALIPDSTIGGIVQGLLCEIGRLVLQILIAVAIAVANLFGFTEVAARLALAQEALNDVNCF
jgi:hypothetical protein